MSRGCWLRVELDEYDKCAVHLLAFEDNMVVGCDSVVFFEGYAKIGRIAVLKEKRGCSYGKIICSRPVDIAREMGAKKVILYSQCSAEEFYKKLGFVPEGEVFDNAGIDHICMVKRL